MTPMRGVGVAVGTNDGDGAMGNLSQHCGRDAERSADAVGSAQADHGCRRALLQQHFGCPSAPNHRRDLHGSALILDCAAGETQRILSSAPLGVVVDHRDQPQRHTAVVRLSHSPSCRSTRGHRIIRADDGTRDVTHLSDAFRPEARPSSPAVGTEGRTPRYVHGSMVRPKSGTWPEHEGRPNAPPLAAESRGLATATSTPVRFGRAADGPDMRRVGGRCPPVLRT